MADELPGMAKDYPEPSPEEQARLALIAELQDLLKHTQRRLDILRTSGHDIGPIK